MPDKIYGVNLAGAEFGGSNLPGIHGQDYIYPQEEQFRYLDSVGIRYARLPLKPERLQRWAGDTLDPYVLHTELYPCLDLAAMYNIKVLIDPHSFGRWYGRPYTTKGYDRRMLRAQIGALVEATCQHSAVWGYEIIGNEPHDMPGDPEATWRLTYEVADEARIYTDKMLVWAPTGWQSARYLPDNSAGFRWAGDANSCIGVHVYGDGDQSGSYHRPYDQDVDNSLWPAGPLSPFTMVARLEHAIYWAIVHGVNLLVTETGTPQEPEWLAMLDQLLDEITSQQSVLGAFLWAGGPWWGDYRLSTEPNADGSDKPQVRSLLKYVTS